MSKDTIYRQAAVSGISDLLMLELKGERLPTYNEVYRVIHNLPSAQPKKGHWIVFETGDDMYACVKCSCCGKSYTVDSRRRVDIGFVKEDLCYCPHCGADMREENDG